MSALFLTYVTHGNTMNDQNGNKDDEGKLRFDLIDPYFEQDFVKVLTQGASHYGANNWKSVSDARNRYIAAMRRHLSAYTMGEDIDPDSGISHMAHITCNAMFLHYFEEKQNDKSIDIRSDEDRDTTMYRELRGIIEQSLLDDDEKKDNDRNYIRAFAYILNELRPHFRFGTLGRHLLSDGSFEIILGPDNTTSYYVSHVSKSTLSRLQRMADRYIPEEESGSGDNQDWVREGD